MAKYIDAINTEVKLRACCRLEYLYATQSQLLVLFKEVRNITAMGKIKILGVHTISPISEQIDGCMTIRQMINALWNNQKIASSAVETLNEFISTVMNCCVIR